MCVNQVNLETGKRKESLEFSSNLGEHSQQNTSESHVGFPQLLLALWVTDLH